MSTTSNVENLASELQSSCSLSGPETRGKAARSRRKDHRVPLRVSNDDQFASVRSPAFTPADRKEAQGVPVHDTLAEHVCDSGSATAHKDRGAKFQDSAQLGSDAQTSIDCDERQDSSRSGSAMSICALERTKGVVESSYSYEHDPRTAAPPDCLSEAACGSAIQLAGGKVGSLEARKPLGLQAYSSLEKDNGDEDVLRVENAFSDDESLVDSSGIQSKGCRTIVCRKPVKKDVNLIKARALTHHFQKLKGELAEAFGDGRELIVDDADHDWPEDHPSSSAKSRLFLGQAWDDGKHEVKLSKLLCEQLKILAGREQAVERRLSMERMEHIVEKVEEEVELEAAMEELLLRMKADEEVMEMQRQEREWEIERREVQFEEEIMVLKSKVRRLEEELSIAHAEKEYALQKKQDEMDEVIRGMLVELREGEEDFTRHKDAMKKSFSGIEVGSASTSNDGLQKQLDSPSKDLFIAFEDLLKEADERTERQRKSLEEVTSAKEASEERFQQERRKWREKDKQNDYRVIALEKEAGRISVLLRDSEAALTSERERRKESRLDMDRTLGLWRAESRSQSEKLRHLESFVVRVATTLGDVAQWASSVDGSQDITQRVRELLQDPNVRVANGVVEVIRAAEGDAELHNSVVAQLTQLRADRVRVEAERDNLEVKLNMLVQKARDREREIEEMWHDRERTLTAKLSNLEAKSEDWELKYSKREAVISQETKKWEQEMESWKQKWVNEKHGWEAMVREREHWVEEQVEKWSSALEERDAEVASLKSEHKRLLETLEANRQRMEDMKQQMVTSRKGMQRARRASQWLDDHDESCNSSEVSSSIDVSALRRQDEGFSENFIDVEKLAIEMEAEIRRTTREVRSKEERFEKERLDMRSGAEQLRQEKQLLEQQVESLKAEMKEHEVQMEFERKQMEEALNMKDLEVKKLESQLDFREHEMELGLHKFREEVRMLDREVERERKVKEQEMEMSIASQNRMKKDMKEKDLIWAKQIETLMQQLEATRAVLEQKNQEFVRFEEEAIRKEAQLEQEKRRWIETAKVEELKMAKAISNLMHEKSLLFDDREREQKQHQQTVDELKTEIMTLRESIRSQEEDVRNATGNAEAGLMKPDLETLWLDYSENRAHVDQRAKEWQVAVDRVADFEKQISAAMHAIECLREELSMKESALVQARVEREAEWERREKAWAQEQQEAASLQEQLREVDRQRTMELQRKEQELIKEKSELMRLLVAEREESGNAISALQGAVRELEWSIKHDTKDRPPDLSALGRTGEMVKVHASHLEEVDTFIRNLKLRVAESERQCEAAQAAVRALEMEKATRNAEVDAALLQMEKDITRISPEARGHPPFQSPLQDRSFLSPTSSRLDGGFDNFRKRARGSLNMGIYVSKPSEKSMLLTTNGLSSSQHDSGWLAGPSEQLSRFMDTDAASSVTSTSNTWLTRHGNGEDSWIPGQERMPLSLNAVGPPRRRQQKWLVDAGWLERVRKEQACLKQQLEVERQRAAAAEQVEAENRWMEAAIARALEQKRESDAKVDELQQLVAQLQNVLAAGGTPNISSPDNRN